MQFSDADSGGQARAKLFMAPNKVRNKKVISPIKQTTLLCMCVQEMGWTGG